MDETLTYLEGLIREIREGRYQVVSVDDARSSVTMDDFEHPCPTSYITDRRRIVLHLIDNQRPTAEQQVLSHRPADPLSEPYDWGPGGMPEGKPFTYSPEKGYDFGEADNG